MPSLRRASCPRRVVRYRPTEAYDGRCHVAMRTGGEWVSVSLSGGASVTPAVEFGYSHIVRRNWRLTLWLSWVTKAQLRPLAVARCN